MSILLYQLLAPQEIETLFEVDAPDVALEKIAQGVKVCALHPS